MPDSELFYLSTTLRWFILGLYDETETYHPPTPVTLAVVVAYSLISALGQSTRLAGTAVRLWLPSVISALRKVRGLPEANGSREFKTM